MTPTGLTNGQDESRCYVNSSFQFHFFNIFFTKLVMNIECNKIIEHLDNCEYEFISDFRKFLILQVIQQTFVKF